MLMLTHSSLLKKIWACWKFSDNLSEYSAILCKDLVMMDTTPKQLWQDFQAPAISSNLHHHDGIDTARQDALSACHGRDHDQMPWGLQADSQVYVGTTKQTFICGHRTLKAPHPVRSAKLSKVPTSQYYGGGPHGNPGCCSYSFVNFLSFARPASRLCASGYFFICQASQYAQTMPMGCQDSDIHFNMTLAGSGMHLYHPLTGHSQSTRGWEGPTVKLALQFGAESAHMRAPHRPWPAGSQAQWTVAAAQPEIIIYYHRGENPCALPPYSTSTYKGAHPGFG